MKYEKRARSYLVGRPAYPEKALDRIFKDMPSSVVVADIGAGTGKLTLMLSERAKQIYAVEPDDRMREILSIETGSKGNITVLDSCAEETRIPDNSVDIICVAQAFHWFDAEKFRVEIKRILRGNGKVFILHNIFPDILESVELDSNKKKEDMVALNNLREQERRNFWTGKCVEMTFDNCVIYDKEQFLNYFLSFSTTPFCKNIDKSAYNAILEKIYTAFEKLSVDGKVAIPFVTKLYTGDLGENSK